jgi:hypothetical protein
MPTPTGQTLTTMAVADGVAAELTTPADSTVWSEPTISVFRGWLPAPKESDLQGTVYLAVIALGRARARGHTPPTENTPRPGRTIRAAVRSTHRVKILLQTLLPGSPADYDGPGGRIDQLASFLMQVDDYWNVRGRQVNQIIGVNLIDNVPTGKPTGVEFWESELNIYRPKAVDEKLTLVGELDLTFSEATPW